MATVPDGRSASRIKRKPPPAFPYSPRYPHPDPTDPFASLQALRDRAHSSQRLGGSNASTSSLTHTPPIPPDNGRQNNYLLADLPPLPRTVLHAARSIDVIDHLRDGYHSDASRPPRPPRSRTRPARDSTSYFSDADIATPSPQARRRNPEPEPSERPTEHQYQSRRRSKTIAIFPVTPAQPAPQEIAQPETPEVPDTSHLSTQYTYDDRQSHGHVYGRGGPQHGPPDVASSEHDHSHRQSSPERHAPTPPMTPDDTLTSSSVSVHEQLGSRSPAAILDDPPSPPPPPKQAASDSDAGHAIADVTVVSRGMAIRDLSRIHTADIPTRRVKAEPDSPAPLPVPPPRPRIPHRAESEPEPEFASKRRSVFGSRKDSLTRRLRDSTLYARDRKLSDPSPQVRPRELQDRDSVVEGSSQGALLASHGDRETGPRHSYDASRALLASGVDASSQAKKRPKVSHRKSLSHVSLGITPLPNVMIGPSPSLAANVSMASTLVACPDSDEFGAPVQELPPLPSLPVHAPQPAAPRPPPRVVQPSPPSHTVAQALELTPLPKRDAPLPPIRKESRLPTPPREERSMREPRPPPAHQPGQTSSRENTYSQSMQRETMHRTPDSDVVLLRPSHFGTHDYEHPSPSPPLSSNLLLSRPTSTFSPIPPLVSVPLISPSPVPPQYSTSTNDFSSHGVPSRTETIARRAHPPSPSPPPPPRRPSPVSQPRRAPSPVYQQRRAPSPIPVVRREPSPPPVSRHTPTPPAPRRAPSPLPPRRDEPPTPAPLPLSPPSRIDHDLPTPLPQPPLPPPPRATVPVYLSELPRGFSAPREADPIRQAEPRPPQRAVSPNYVHESSRAFSPHSDPARPRTPPDLRHESRESRRSEERQQQPASYVPPSGAQGGLNLQIQALQQPVAAAAANPRTKTSTSPYNSVRQHTSTRRTIHDQAHHAQTQPSHLPFRSETPPPAHHVPPRAQTPEDISVPRAQSPTHLPSGRAQSPSPAVITTRVQSSLPSARVQAPPVQTSSAPTRVPPPPSSYSQPHTQVHPRMHSQPSSVSHEGETGAEEFGRIANNASQSTVASPQARRVYATSAESTPLPLPETPSTTFSHPYRSHGGPRRTRNTRSGSAPPRSAMESRRHRRRKEEPSAATFDEYAGLTRDQISRAAALTVIAQNGLRVPFGELFKDRKTIVVFIRHFWCPMCQDYMYSISRNVDYEALKRAGYDMVIIGNGSQGMIKSYRHIFRTPIPMYTDPSLRLYAALGMTLRTTNPGPDSEKGDYVRHGVIGGIAMVVRNALRVGMPVWEKGGDATQLGGEFVMGPGLNCSFAHRMTTTRSHAPILDVLMAAGYHFSIPTAPDGAPSLSPEEEEAWMEERRRSLARMRAKREKRREAGPAATHVDDADFYEPELGYDSDSGSVSAQGSWTSSVEKRELAALVAERKRERERKRKPAVSKRADGTLKKGIGLHVSNPDDHYDHREYRDREREHEHEREHQRKHYGPTAPTRVHVAQAEDTPDWNGGSVSLAYINELGRREDGYETVEEGTPAYSYRRD